MRGKRDARHRGGARRRNTIRTKKHSRTSICAQRWWEALQPGRQSRPIALGAPNSIGVSAPQRLFPAKLSDRPALPTRLQRGWFGSTRPAARA